MATLPLTRPSSRVRELFEKHREDMLTQFVAYAALPLQNLLEQAMENVLVKLEALTEDKLDTFLRGYRYYPNNYSDQEEAGLRPLWKSLTLIELTYPDWSVVSFDNFANLLLVPQMHLHLQYALHNDTMFTIVLDLAERMWNSENRSLYEIVGFFGPKRLVLDNTDQAWKQNDKGNLCEHCRPSREKPTFEKILIDFGGSGRRGLLGIESTTIDRVSVTCAACLHQVAHEACDLVEFTSRINEVMI